VPSENPEMQTQRTTPPPAGKWVRISLLAIGGMLVVVFALAVYLNPYNTDGSPRSMATHTKLGLPPCNFVVLAGKPCPSCGMTTSFALLVRGDVGNSLSANWVGTALAVTWAALLLWCFASAIANRLFFIPEGRGETVLTVFVGGFLILMVGRWVAILIT